MTKVQVENPTKFAIILPSHDGNSVQIQPGSKAIVHEKFLFQHHDTGVKISKKQPAHLNNGYHMPSNSSTVVLPVATNVEPIVVAPTPVPTPMPTSTPIPTPTATPAPTVTATQAPK